jgi:hypothetical protein
MRGGVAFQQGERFPMNKSILLLIVIGLAAAGWLHRETISGWMAQRTAGEGPAEDASQSPEAGSPGNPVKPSVTPNPAAEAVAQARKDLTLRWRRLGPLSTSGLWPSSMK